MPDITDGPIMPSVETTVMELLRNSTRRIIPAAVRYQSELEPRIDIVTGSMVIEMSTYVLADRVGKGEVTVDRWTKEWESWWQHTKAVHFPTLSRWLRRPPRKRRVHHAWTINLRQYFTFPEANVYPVDLGKPVPVEMIYASYEE